MPTKLDVNTGNTDLGKKIWEIHQKNEETHVNAYKEAVCFGCLKNDAAGAGIFDICGDCAGKRGREALLVSVKPVYYGLCYFCGDYKFHMEQINVRLCKRCHERVAKVMKKYNQQGGQFGSDPFWQRMRKKHGKDWKVIMSKGLGNKR